MFKSSLDTLEQFKQVLLELPKDCYSKPCSILSNASIGQHTRHIIELYLCLIKGYELSDVSYDRRERNLKIEKDLTFALEQLTYIQTNLEKENKSIKICYELAGEASDVTLQVLDGRGNVVWSGEGPGKSDGVHGFTWNGQTTGGGQVADGGVYTLKVVAKDGAGEAVDNQVLIQGRISGVELYDGEPYLTIGNSILPLSSVIALQQANDAATTPTDSTDDESLLASVASAFNPLKYLS